MSASPRRVVITGAGLVSPLGQNRAELQQALAEGESGVRLLENLPTEGLPVDFGGECTAFRGEIDDFGSFDKQLKRQIKRGLRLMCRDIKLGVAAAQRALADAGIEPDSTEPARFGTVFGCDYIITEPADFSKAIESCLNDDHEFEFERWGESGVSNVEPLWLLKYLPNMPASHVAIFNNFQGPSNSITLREASSNLAIGEATTIIQRGMADRMVAGATGSRIHPLQSIHWLLQETFADRHSEAVGGDPAKACRPFDLHRSGTVLGEGAAVLVLEELSVAQERGANILGEVCGYGSSTVQNPDGKPGFQTALENSLLGALETSGWSPADVGHVHAHGQGTQELDRQEAAAIQNQLPACPVTAAKSYFGNLGCGSGMVETKRMIAALVSVKFQSFPSKIPRSHSMILSPCPKERLAMMPGPKPAPSAKNP